MNVFILFPFCSVGTQCFARFPNGFYYKGLVSYSTTSSLTVLSVSSSYASFNRSDWQAVVPNVRIGKKISLNSSRVLSRIHSNKYQPGTIIYIGPSYSVYKVRFDFGGYQEYHTTNELLLLLPGFTGMIPFLSNLKPF